MEDKWHFTDEWRQRIIQGSDAARGYLLAERGPGGVWAGRLSSSALSTATAVIALSVLDAPGHAGLIRRGLEWLTDTQTADGGWGDTEISLANLSTTLLARAAYGAAGEAECPAMERSAAWVTQAAGGLEPEMLAAALAQRYGKDRTFSVPILMACALGGMLGPAPGCWRPSAG